MKININHYWRVKLTPYGKMMYRHEIERHNQMWGGSHPTAPKLDADGYYRDQAREIIRIFGSAIGMGRNLPFETEVIVEVRP